MAMLHLQDDPGKSRADMMDQQVREQWMREQHELKKHLILEDTESWALEHLKCEECCNSGSEEEEDYEPQSDHAAGNCKQHLKYLGGVDISFVKDDLENACAALVVVRLPDLEVVYTDLSMVKLIEPYIPGFLAFREADFLVEKVKKLKEEKPEYMPQVILVDGNGILHNEGFGLASHLGVLLDIPTFGVAKKLFQVDGLEKNEEHKDRIRGLQNGGDTFDLVGTSGRILGKAMRTHAASTNPVYVSQGHKISLPTCVWVVNSCSNHRIPEPVRQADIMSREYIREHFVMESTDTSS